MPNRFAEPAAVDARTAKNHDRHEIPCGHCSGEGAYGNEWCANCLGTGEAHQRCDDCSEKFPEASMSGNTCPVCALESSELTERLGLSIQAIDRARAEATRRAMSMLATCNAYDSSLDDLAERLVAAKGSR